MQNLSRKHLTLFFLIIGSFVLNFFHPIPVGYDIDFYRRMGQIAIGGGNPYLDPYADFPPLKMALMIALTYINGWVIFSILTWALLLGLSALYLKLRYDDPNVFMLGMSVLIIPTVYRLHWVLVWEDKIVYPILFLSLLVILSAKLSRSVKLTLITLILGIMQAYGGPGLFLLPLILIWVYQSGTLKDALIVCAGFLMIVGVSHLMFFPDWIEGYHRRSIRMTAQPSSNSLWMLLYKATGLYHRLAPTITIIICSLLTYLAYIKKWLSLHRALFLAYFTLLAFGPEQSFDRTLAAFIPGVFLIAEYPLAIISILMILSFIPLMPLQPEALHGIALMWLPSLIVVGCLLGTKSGEVRDDEAFA